MLNKKLNRPHPTMDIDRPSSFHLVCRAGDSGCLDVVSDSVSFTIAQRARIEDVEQMWDSVQVSCQKEPDGSLSVQVLVWDPKLPEALRIACIKSRPDNKFETDTLECDLSQQMLE